MHFTSLVTSYIRVLASYRNRVKVMARGVKRKREENGPSDRKRPGSAHVSPVRRDLLQQYYPKVQTLRDHVISKLPGSSRLRRKKIASLGGRKDRDTVESTLAHVLDTTLVCSSESPPSTGESAFQQFLSFSQQGDESYVSLSDGVSASTEAQSEVCCCHTLCSCPYSSSRAIDCRLRCMATLSKGAESFDVAQASPVRWIPQRGQGGCFGRPRHSWNIQPLSQSSRSSAQTGALAALAALAGAVRPAAHGRLARGLLYIHGPRCRVGQLLSAERYVTALLASDQSGPALTRCRGPLVRVGSIQWLTHFSPRLPPCGTETFGYRNHEKAPILCQANIDCSWSDSARLPKYSYARPVSLPVGSRSQAADILNKCLLVRQPAPPQSGSSVPQLDTENHNEVSTRKAMMYMFPRQFGLHNVFTSKVNATHHVEEFTSREDQIATLIPQGNDSGSVSLPKLPKRLRGAARHLVRRLLILHGRCSYSKTLRHYCPTHLDKHTRPKQADWKHDAVNAGTTNRSQPMVSGVLQIWCARPATMQLELTLKTQRTSPSSEETPLVDLACPASCVSAFCQAVLSKTIPDEFWGDGDTLCHNKKSFMHKVDHFIKLRRFESMTLHEISQGLKASQAVGDLLTHCTLTTP